MLCHWDDVPEFEIAREHLRGRRWRLGAAAGATRVGLSRFVLGPGERPMPVHAHGGEEEVFVVLAGSGRVLLGDRAHAVAAGDVIAHPAGGPAHTIAAGDDGLDVLAFGSGTDTPLTWLPRAGAWWAGPHWMPGDGPNPFRAEDAAGPLDWPEPEAARPRAIAAIREVELRERRRGDVQTTDRALGDAVGLVRSGLSEINVDPGALSNPPHCHSGEEELFVVLDGDGALELLHPDGTAESHPVHAGHVVCRPPGTGVAHAFGAGDHGLRLLAYSDRDPGDLCFYPRSGKVNFRGLKVIARVQRVDYWDGEA
ncbi:MAG: cupin domain-containing protein [Solirubrobacteraceae bacterium]|jgi:uncharacterized cupin superfamily protein|nr:cupin domain-containing protein [Solirubrobacteraceae bacterium]